MKSFFHLTIIGLLLFFSQAHATVSLSKIFSDNMVLQRDREIKVWGWADKGETVSVAFNGKSVKAKADRMGKWMVKFAAVHTGGPLTMKIAGKKNTLELKNILMGDVWVCSGQSNMEWIIRNTNNAQKEIAAANYDKIRLFTVEKAMGYQTEADLKGGSWLVCSPESVEEFSAVAYFFARKLQKELEVPIGLVHTSWGGTNVETWTSWDVMGQLDPYKSMDVEKQIASAAEQAKNHEVYTAALQHDKGLEERWYDAAAAVSGWKKIAVPAEWGQTPIGNVDGIVWYKKTITLPKDVASGSLSLGPIDDFDETYVNGKLVCSTNGYAKDRVYALESGVLKPGLNTIVVKVRDDQGGGGINGEAKQVFLTANGKSYSLASEWEYKPSVVSSDFGVMAQGPNSFPSLLYNAMLAPITDLGIKGAIWYQGESNTYMAYRYRTYFPNMINDWRKKFGYDFPFLWVQLANFMAPVDQPKESSWAELREAQSMTLSLPKTGEAVIIDIGETNSIHPRNKQDVGLRLALAALKVAYDKEVVYSGPRYASMEIEGNKIILSFSTIGSGLMAKDKYGYLKGFAIAGSDKKFVWATARIEGDNVIVTSDQVKNPTAVRYAWGDNPDDANLYNKEDLPTSPFRTDTWKGVTEGK